MSYKAQSDSVSSSSNDEVKMHTHNRPQYEQPHLTFDNKVNRLVVPLYCGTCREYGCKCSSEEPGLAYSSEGFPDVQVPRYGQTYSFGQSSPLPVAPSNDFQNSYTKAYNFSTGIATNEFINNGLNPNVKSLNKSLSSVALPPHIPKEPLNNFYLIQQQQLQHLPTLFYQNTPTLSNQLNSGLSNYQHTNSEVNLVINPLYQHQQLSSTPKNQLILTNNIFNNKTNNNLRIHDQMGNYIAANSIKKHNGERYDHNRRNSKDFYDIAMLRSGSGFFKKNREYFILDNYGSNGYLSSQSVSSNSSNFDSNFKANANILPGIHKNKHNEPHNNKKIYNQGRLCYDSYLTFDNKKSNNLKSPTPNTSVRNKKFAAYESILNRYSQDSSTSSSLSSSPTPLLDQFSSLQYDTLNKNDGPNLRQMSNLNRNKSFHFDNRVPKIKPSQILCRLGNNCRFKRENKCKYYHPINLRYNNSNRFKNEIVISDYTIDLDDGSIDLETLTSMQNTKNHLTSKKAPKSTNIGSKEDLSLSIYSSTSSLASLKKLNLESFNVTANILNVNGENELHNSQLQQT